MFSEAKGNAEFPEFGGKQILEGPGKSTYNVWLRASRGKMTHSLRNEMCLI